MASLPFSDPDLLVKTNLFTKLIDGLGRSLLFSYSLKSGIQPICIGRGPEQVCGLKYAVQFTGGYHGNILAATPLNNDNFPIIYDFIDQ